jgi:hypothetical protein
VLFVTGKPAARNWLAQAGATMNDCWHCKHQREVTGNAHIMCVNPDPDMTGDSHGIKKGWFMYPLLFDPIWTTKKCVNFENNAVSNPVSGAVSE